MEPGHHVCRDNQKEFIFLNIHLSLLDKSISLAYQIQNSQIVIRMDMSNEDYAQIDKSLFITIVTVVIGYLNMCSLAAIEHHQIFGSELDHNA